jgi:hypothetical protein
VANGGRRALLAADALGFALRLLRAHPSGDARQHVGFVEDVGGLVQVAISQGGQEAGDIDTDRAALDAFAVLASQAAFGFCSRGLDGQPLVHLPEVPGARFRILFRHVLPGYFHSFSRCHLHASSTLQAAGRAASRTE